MAAARPTSRCAASARRVIALRPESKLVEGRWFKPGLHELVVGRGAQQQFAGLISATTSSCATRIGPSSARSPAAVTPTSRKSSADADTVLAAYQRTLFQSVRVLLESPAALSVLKDALTSNPQLSVEVERETDYLAKVSATLTKVMTLIANVVGGIMAVGAMFGALNTMYSAVSARTREIATLRAIGFGGSADCRLGAHRRRCRCRCWAARSARA